MKTSVLLLYSTAPNALKSATPESMFLGTTNETRRICGKTSENHTSKCNRRLLTCLADFYFVPSHLYGRRRDYRTRRNRTQALINAFKPEMPAIADAYMVWDARSSEDGLGTLLGPPNDSVIENYLPVLVIDLFGASNFHIL